MKHPAWILLCVFCGVMIPVLGQPAAEAETGTTKGSQMVMLEKPVQADEATGFVKKYSFERGSSSVYDTLLQNTKRYRSSEVPKPSQQLIRQRLSKLPTRIQMDHNMYVQRYIDVYTLRKREQVSRMLGLSRVYFPMFEAYLDREGMPMELKYLAVVESALNPHARSWVGATGLWQFMYQTGRMHGLKVDSYVDERKDPDKATKAAIAYLKKSHEEFGDWLLAIASYNCGPGNVRRAIMRSGGKRNFWDIRAYLPRETRGYVPAFIAAAYTFEYAGAHNLYPLYVDFEAHQDTVHLRQMDITLQEVANMTGTKISDLRHLNPELKMERVPFQDKIYVLRVPSKAADYFAQHHREIVATYGKKRTKGYAGPASTSSSSSSYAKSSYAPYKPPKGTTKVNYVVKTGDVVGSIAERYGVSARQISSWNNLRRYRIKVGQKLKIYTKHPKGLAISPSSSSSSSPTAIGPGTYHTVKSGDTLWGLAKAYNVSIESLQRLNRGSDTRNLKLGQKVRVK